MPAKRWLGSYGGEDSSSDMYVLHSVLVRSFRDGGLRTASSRGIFAGTIGVRRLLKLFDQNNIKTTFFIPGHSLESFPEECALIRDAGHEIGLHGYSHENPVAMTLEQQDAIMAKCVRLLTDFCGKPPRGIVAPWWEGSKEGAELMLKYGVEYDHSYSHHDCQAYWLRTGDDWVPIDYSKHPDHWMSPLKTGQMTAMVEIPASWYLDDLPPMMFIKKAPNSHGWVDPKVVEELWKDQFDYHYDNEEEFVFPVTIHPDVSGHPHALKMVERIIKYINRFEGVEWVTMEQISDDFKSKNKPVAGAWLPAKPGEYLQNPNLKLQAADAEA